MDFITVFSIFSLAVLFGVLVIIICMRNFRQHKVHIFLFVLLFVIGGILQYFGISHSKVSNSEVLMIAKAAFNSAQMFAASFGVNDFGKLAEVNPIYLAAILSAQLVMVFYSAYVLFQLFKQKAINFLRQLFSRKKNLLVLVCDNQNSDAFLDSLKKKKNRKIYLLLPETMKEQKAHYLAHSIHPVVLVMSQKEGLKQALSKRKEDTKIWVVSIMTKDEDNLKTLQILSKDYENIPIEAFIMYQDFGKSQYMEVVKKACGRIHFFSQYDLVSKQFLDAYPLTKLINQADIDTSSATLADIEVSYFFLGFGKTNKEILKKIFCDHQFLAPSVKYYVHSVNVKEDEDTFKQQIRYLQFQKNPNEEYLPFPRFFEQVSFDSYDVRSASFYRKLATEGIKGYRIFLIALGNETSNMETAFELRQFLIQQEKEKQSRIFVKCKSGEIFSEPMKFSSCPIIPFGQSKSTFTETLIIGEELDRIAKNINREYEICSGNKEMNSDLLWGNLSLHDQNSNIYTAFSIRMKLNLMGLDLKVTDSGLSEEEYYQVYDPFCERMQYSDTKSLSWEEIQNHMKKQSIRNHLNYQEHLRWNAFMLMAGWVPMSINQIKEMKKQKDPLRKLHGCLTDYQGLIQMYTVLEKEKIGNSYDNIRKDFFTMDHLPRILSDTPYKIVKLANEIENEDTKTK